MTIYRLPFDDDGLWTYYPGLGNWDDPATDLHQPYAFDFHHPVGGIVRAVRGGVVCFTENHDGNTTEGDPVEGYGTAVLIRHVDGTVAAYNHLKSDSIEVKKNQVVSQGRVIARSGNTGQSFAPHLHFGICTFWNSVNDLGPDFPVQFQDKNHVAWRPRIGDALASNNATLRQEGWAWCHKCQGLFFCVKTTTLPTSDVVQTIPNSAGTCPAGGAHERAGSANYILVHDSQAPGQSDWRWCKKCQGLFYGENPGSKCPAGGAHSQGGSGNYVVNNSPDAPGQPDWRWCNKCQGLFYGGNPGSKCPAGGAHSKTGSGKYTLVQMGPGHPEPDWRFCSKCQGLFYGGNPGSKCPAGGAHSQSGSGNYFLIRDYMAKNAPGQPNWRWCKKCQGLFYGSSGSNCPAGGTHSKTGSGNYVLVDSLSPNAPGQPDWRRCKKCQSLFFGANAGSKCPAGGAHAPHADDCQNIRDQIEALRAKIKQIQSAPGYKQGPKDPKPGKPDPEDLAEVKKLQAKIAALTSALENCSSGKYRLLLDP